jgi:STE24 endopeptidase
LLICFFCVGHWKLNHNLKNLILAQLSTLLQFWTFGQVMNTSSLYRDFGFEHSSTMIGLMLFQFLYSPINHMFSFLMNVLSRQFEFEADAFAKQLGYAQQLKQGLITLHKENKVTKQAKGN